MRLMVKRLALGTPARYDDAGTEQFVFDDWRFNLDHFAIVGALANVVSGLPGSWTPPTILDGEGQDTGIVDRDAVEADVIARVAPTIVWPADITYAEDDPNPYQTTLDANSAPAAMRGWGAVPASWNPVSEL
jgi:hypothetical protein